MYKSIGIIGIGNCGSQVAALAEKKYPKLIDSIYMNTSDSDLAQVDEGVYKFKIGNKAEVEGSGKNRTKMKEYLLADIQRLLQDVKFQEIMSYKKYVFIVASTAGGTGSGAAPVLMEVLRACFKDAHFILVGVLPSIQASLMEQGNALEFLHELYHDVDQSTTYMIYDNETAVDHSPTKALEVVNNNIVEDIRVLSGADNYPTPYDSIDEADMESIITTPGRLLVSRVTSGITEKVMEDTLIDDIIIKNIKKSSHAETDRNKKVVRWGIITYFTEAVNKLYITNFDKLTDFIGVPVERFNHHAIHHSAENLNFLHLIASGLSPINDRSERITERIEVLKGALAEDDASRYIYGGESVSYDVTETRRKEVKMRDVAPVKPTEIFSKFMKK